MEMNNYGDEYLWRWLVKDPGEWAQRQLPLQSIVSYFDKI